MITIQGMLNLILEIIMLRKIWRTYDYIFQLKIEKQKKLRKKD